jgi:hypothetical protein
MNYIYDSIVIEHGYYININIPDPFIVNKNIIIKKNNKNIKEILNRLWDTYEYHVKKIIEVL